MYTNPNPTAPSGAMIAVSFLIWAVLYVVFALGMYGTFKKAGQPGWAGFVPIYNFIIMLKIAGRPLWWGWFLLLPIVPFLGSIALLVVAIIVLNDVSTSFGHGPGFTVGLVLLGPIFWYILWLGSSQYRGPAALAGYQGGGYGGGQYYGQPGQYPQGGQQYPGFGQPGQYPSYPQQPGQYPPPGQYPQQPGQYPQAPGQQPGQYPQAPGQQPGQYPQDPGQYPQNPEPPRGQ